MPETPNPKISRPVDPPRRVAHCAQAYAELDVTTNFSFLRGASHPDELVYRAAELGYRALAVTDVNSVAGVVRAHQAAKDCGLKILVGSRLTFEDGTGDLLVTVVVVSALGAATAVAGSSFIDTPDVHTNVWTQTPKMR
jgi:hypothetical protein